MEGSQQMNKDLRRYADMVITTGVSLYQGQKLYIKTGPAAYYFAQMLGEAAYEQGSGYVHIEIEDSKLIHSRLTALPASEEITFPAWKSSMLSEMMNEDWAYIRIEETDDPQGLQHTPPDLVQAYTAANHKLHHTFKNSMMNNEHTWCVICAPSSGWARQVLGPKGTVEELWDILKPILRLDHEDPSQAWKEHGSRLNKRCMALDALQLKTLHITDEGTDLTIGLTPHARWIGGNDARIDGRVFFANIPTEESFSVPDRELTEGTLRLTKPVSIMDTLVEGVTLTFSKGKVVSYTAEENVHLLDRFFTIDEGTRYLGEIALVDTSSPIFQSGKLFNSVLYDENASCHVALGQGYSGCLNVDPPAVTDELKRQYNCNISMEHSDVMLGSAATKITAEGYDGRTHLIMEKGKLLV